MELSWTTRDRARAMVKSKRDAGFTIPASFADEVAAAMDSEVEQRTKELEDEKSKLLLQVDGLQKQLAKQREAFAVSSTDRERELDRLIGACIDAMMSAQTGIIDAVILEDGLDGRAAALILDQLHDAMRQAGREDAIVKTSITLKRIDEATPAPMGLYHCGKCGGRPCICGQTATAR